MALAPGDLVLCSGTLRRDATFEERIAAAAAGGFSGVSLWGRDYKRARQEGLEDSDLRTMLDDKGLSVGEIDPLWSWLPGTSQVSIPAALDDLCLFEFSQTELFEIAEAVGARSVNAVDILGGTWTTTDATEAFAALCDRAADHGLLVHIEFLPWSKIPDIGTAWEIVREAGRPNGGLAVDAWHYFRGTPDLSALSGIPGDRVLNVQLSDGPAQPEEDLPHAALHDRLLPGDGALDLASLVEALHRIRATAPIGIEVLSDRLHELAAVDAGRRAGESMRRLLSRT